MNEHALRVRLFVCSICFVAVQGVFPLSGQANGQQAQQPAQQQAGQKGGKQAGNGGPQSSTKTTGYSPFDSFAVTGTAAPITFAIPPECLATSNGIIDTASLLASFATSADTLVKPVCIVKGVAQASQVKFLEPGNGIILHVVKWKSAITPATDAKPEVDQYQPMNGAWGFYVVEKDNSSLGQAVDSSGTPYFYKVKHVYLVDINLFDDGSKTPAQAEIDYSIQGTARQKQNASDLTTLVNALLKLSTPTAQGKQGAAAPEVATVLGIIQEVTPSVPLPYDLSVTASLNSPKGASSAARVPCAQGSQGANGGQANQTACSASKTVTNYDAEYWDISLGLAIPGPVEKTYKSTTTSGTTTITPTRVTHTDAYAFADVYFLQMLSKSPGGLSSLPHFNFGIPITSQSLHRPYVGIAENLTFLTSRLKLGIPLSVFAGPVFMKQQIEVPGTTTLQWDHATKMIYGVELSIGSISNYLKGGGNSKSGNSSKSGGSTGSGGN